LTFRILLECIRITVEINEKDKERNILDLLFFNDTFFVDILEIIYEKYPKSTKKLIISEVTKAFEKENFLSGCIIINAYYFKDLLEEYVENGTIDFLFQLLELESVQLNYNIFNFFVDAADELLSFKGEFKFFLANLIKFIQKCPKKFTMEFIEMLTRIMRDINPSDEFFDFDELDIEFILEAILENEDNSFFSNSSILIRNQKQLDLSECIVRVIDKFLEKLNSFSNISPFSDDIFSDLNHIISTMKYNFRAWIHKTFKQCVVQLRKEFKYHCLEIMKNLIVIFGEECEVYISKYKVIDLLAEILRQFKDNQGEPKDYSSPTISSRTTFHKSIEILLYMSDYQSKSLEISLNKIFDLKLFLDIPTM
jgi:hypothetical protein